MRHVKFNDDWKWRLIGVNRPDGSPRAKLQEVGCDRGIRVRDHGMSNVIGRKELFGDIYATD